MKAPVIESLPGREHDIAPALRSGPDENASLVHAALQAAAQNAPVARTRAGGRLADERRAARPERPVKRLRAAKPKFDGEFRCVEDRVVRNLDHARARKRSRAPADARQPRDQFHRPGIYPVRGRRFLLERIAGRRSVRGRAVLETVKGHRLSFDFDAPGGERKARHERGDERSAPRHFLALKIFTATSFVCLAPGVLRPAATYCSSSFVRRATTSGLELATLLVSPESLLMS